MLTGLRTLASPREPWQTRRKVLEKLEYNRVKRAEARKTAQKERLKFKTRFLLRAARFAGGADARAECEVQVKLKNQHMREASA